jgi:ZIP family zinc transporter
MVVDTLIPEAYEEAHDYSGLITAAGFLLAFALHKASA